jgi:DNA ligase-1
MLAVEVELEKLEFPVIASPKLDGIRAVIKDGKVLSRSLKPIPNKHIQKQFSRYPILNGLDGELIVGSPLDKNCMQNTTSGVMSQDGEPNFKYYVFDYWTHPDRPFETRIGDITRWKNTTAFKQCSNFVVVLKHIKVDNMEELLQLEEQYLKMGYEGVMIRKRDAPYKYGRSTVKQGYLLKLKRFADSEAEVVEAEELLHNHNEATLDALGNTVRSDHKDGKVGGDTLGALVVKDITTGITFKIGTGFDATTRQELWDMHKEGVLVGKIVKYKSFLIGVKEAPRFPVFLGFRDKLDM